MSQASRRVDPAAASAWDSSRKSLVSLTSATAHSEAAGLRQHGAGARTRGEAWPILDNQPEEGIRAAMTAAPFPDRRAARSPYARGLTGD